jgi:hypothetical protein
MENSCRPIRRAAPLTLASLYPFRPPRASGRDCNQRFLTTEGWSLAAPSSILANELIVHRITRQQRSRSYIAGKLGHYPGAGSVLHIHNFEALSAKNLKCAIFIGVFVDHDCAISRLFLAGMRGDTRPLKATDTIRHVTSGPMAFTMEDPNFFHA